RPDAAVEVGRRLLDRHEIAPGGPPLVVAVVDADLLAALEADLERPLARVAVRHLLAIDPVPERDVPGPLGGQDELADPRLVLRGGGRQRAGGQRRREQEDRTPLSLHGLFPRLVSVACGQRRATCPHTFPFRPSLPTPGPFDGPGLCR